MGKTEKGVIRVVFAGSPGIAVPALRALAGLEAGGVCALAAVLTNPDSAKGRGGKSGPTEVAAAALALSPGKRILKFEKLDGNAREAVAALEPDLLVSFAYGKIFGPKFLALFPLGGINVHPSLLPRWRGPAPIQAAILHGDAETGVCVQRLAAEMDGGDILARERFPLSERETSLSLAGTAAETGASLAAALIRRVAAEGRLPAGEKQGPEGVRYSALITKEMGRIDWRAGTAEIDRKIRAFTPWPLCLTGFAGSELYLLEGRPFAGDTAGLPEGAPPGTVLGADKKWGVLIRTGDGIFAAERFQFPARKALDWRSFLNGARNFIGSVLE
ncbi:MAG: methionyl-tRNA formyltransferase [Treponema sp.]|jgi:methionyl-tRNA formyltransferase|nr:methionyl-tRNA formyltransferase [Treponema sp.]